MDSLRRRNSPETPNSEGFDAEILRSPYRGREEFGGRISEAANTCLFGVQEPEPRTLAPHVRHVGRRTGGAAARPAGTHVPAPLDRDDDDRDPVRERWDHDYSPAGVGGCELGKPPGARPRTQHRFTANSRFSCARAGRCPRGVAVGDGMRLRTICDGWPV